MHDINNPYNRIDNKIAYSPELLGKECGGCARLLGYDFFRRDASSKDGRVGLCGDCERQPRLSLSEHQARLEERNFNAAGAQRWEYQEEYKNDAARVGRAMHHSAFLGVLKKLVPDLYITEGNIVGDLAVFRTYPCPQPQLDGRDFEYLFYCPTGLLPEYSQYEFDRVRDVAIREKQRGWRTILLRLILRGMLSEITCDKVFGRADGPASSVWYRRLWAARNK